jgi:hypothetical protein
MPARRSDVLILVEDPGAANFVAELPDVLARRGYQVHLATGGTATDYLAQRGIATEPLSPDSDLVPLIERTAPRLVLIGTAEHPDSVGLKLVALAAARRIPSVGVLDASTNLAHRFRGNGTDPLQYCPDTVIVPDSISHDGLVALGLAQDRIVLAGHPHWDYVRAAGRQLQSQDRAALRRRLFGAEVPDRRILVFAAEILGGLDPHQLRRTSAYSLIGTGGSIERSEIVMEELLHALAPLRSRVFLVLRLHPKNAPGDFAAHFAAFDTVSKTEPVLALLHAADAVVGMTSMLMIEAALLNRPTLAILPRAEEVQWLPTAATGVTPFATNRAEVEKNIAALVVSPRPPDAGVLERLFPPHALERVTAAVEQLLSA